MHLTNNAQEISMKRELTWEPTWKSFVRVVLSIPDKLVPSRIPEGVEAGGAEADGVDGFAT